MARLKDLFGRKANETSVSSGDRGKPAADLLARIEQTHPGIEEKIGLSSAALRAGQLVREMRKSRAWTQTQLADLLGWDQERISNIERGEGTRGPTFDVLHKIAVACDYDLLFSPREQAVAAKVGPSTGAKSQFGNMRVEATGAIYAGRPLARP
jgi:transcriptional regulator with XRE-family HTH domain